MTHRLTVIVPNRSAASRIFTISVGIDFASATDEDICRALAECTALRFDLRDELERRRVEARKA